MAIKLNGATLSGNGRHGLNVPESVDVDAEGANISYNKGDAVHVRRAAVAAPPEATPATHKILRWVGNHLVQLAIALLVILAAWYFGLNGNRELVDVQGSPAATVSAEPSA